MQNIFIEWEDGMCRLSSLSGRIECAEYALTLSLSLCLSLLVSDSVYLSVFLSVLIFFVWPFSKEIA